PVARALMGADEDFERLVAALGECSVPALACNVFLPGGLKVVGPDVDAGQLRRYLETSLARMERIGAHVLVVGSGTARSVPDGFDRDRALAQFEALLRDVAE